MVVKIVVIYIYKMPLYTMYKIAIAMAALQIIILCFLASRSMTIFEIATSVNYGGSNSRNIKK